MYIKKFEFVFHLIFFCYSNLSYNQNTFVAYDFSNKNYLLIDNNKSIVDKNIDYVYYNSANEIILILKNNKYYSYDDKLKILDSIGYDKVYKIKNFDEVGKYLIKHPKVYSNKKLFDSINKIEHRGEYNRIIIDKNNNSTIIDTLGNIIFKTNKKLFNIKRTINNTRFICYDEFNKYGVFDKFNNLLIPFKHTNINSYEYIDNNKRQYIFLAIDISKQDTIEYTVYDYNGKVLIENTEFDEINIIENYSTDIEPTLQEFIPVSLDKKWGYINLNKKILIPFIYDFAYPFTNGIATVKLNNIVCLINSKNEIILKRHPNKQYMPIVFSDYNIAILDDYVTDNNNKTMSKYGLINNSGKYLVKPFFDNIEYYKWANYYRTELNQKKGIINFEGKTIFEPEFDHIQRIENPKFDKYFIFKNNKNYGIIDVENKIIIENKYNNINYFKECNCYVSDNNSYNLIIFDYNFKLKLELKCDDYKLLNEKYIAIINDGKSKIINYDGELIFEY